MITTDALAVAIHESMCDVSHHDRFTVCKNQRKYELIAADVSRRLLTASLITAVAGLREMLRPLANERGMVHMTFDHFVDEVQDALTTGHGDHPLDGYRYDGCPACAALAAAPVQPNVDPGSLATEADVEAGRFPAAPHGPHSHGPNISEVDHCPQPECVSYRLRETNATRQEES